MGFRSRKEAEAVIKKIAVLGGLTLLLMAFAACGEEEVRKLIVLAYDSFDISEEIIAEFRVGPQKAGC